MIDDTYLLFHKNIPLILFSYEKSEVTAAFVRSNNYQFLPLPLKPLVTLNHNYYTDDKEGIYALNEEGCGLLEMWLLNREIPTNRDNLDKKIDYTELMFAEHACSFTDCYWIRRASDNKLFWGDVNFYINSNIASYAVITNDKRKFYAGANATLGGQLEKFWYCSNKNGKPVIKLCKRVPRAYGMLAARELWATKIYKALGYHDAVSYDLIYDSDNFVVGCKCEAFTSERLELITASDLLEEQHLTSSDTDAYSDIIKCAVAYGADQHEVERYLSVQAIVDYLITNRDRHLGNIGFLRNSDTLEIVKPAPIYDSGSSAFLEAAYPESVDTTTINGCYKTEQESLLHIPDWNSVNLNHIPDDLSWLSKLNIEMSQNREDTIKKLFYDKLLYLRNIQKEHLTIVSNKMSAGNVKNVQ